MLRLTVGDDHQRSSAVERFTRRCDEYSEQTRGLCLDCRDVGAAYDRVTKLGNAAPDRGAVDRLPESLYFSRRDHEGDHSTWNKHHLNESLVVSERRLDRLCRRPRCVTSI